MQDQTTPQHYRVKAVADMYDVSVSTIYRAIAAGDLDAVRIGTGKGAIRIPEHAIHAFNETCAIEPWEAAADPEVLAGAAGDVDSDVSVEVA